MIFDPKSLLTAPSLTVDDLAAELAKASAAGMGGRVGQAARWAGRQQG
jgi:hypothetical protein